MIRCSALVLAAGLLVAGCSGTTNGTGHVADGPPSITTPPRTSVPPTSTPPTATPPPSSTTSRPPRNPLACPNVTYSPGRLAFPCVTGSLQPDTGDPVWALSLSREVEPGWALAEGASKISELHGRSLVEVAKALRAQAIGAGQYGPHPGVRTLTAKATTVSGVPAYVLETAFTIDQTFRVENGLNVQVERLWIVTLNAGDGQVAAWFVTIPDDVSSLWPKVPELIKQIGLI